MIKNSKENIERLKQYLDSKNYNDIDILDLMKFIAIHYGANVKTNTSIKTLQKDIKLNDRVVFVLLDGFGYKKALEVNNEYIIKKNLLRSIDTVNPTSTACVLTSLASGKYPSEHGVFGWWQYSRKDDLNYYPLLFKGRKTEVDLNEVGYKIRDLFSFNSLFDDFKGKVNIFMNRNIINSDYSLMFAGKNSHRIGAYSIRDSFAKVKENLQSDDGKSFNYLYIEGLDKNSHQCGINSKEVDNIILEVEEGVKSITEDIENVTVILTADHGQINMRNMIYLNKNKDYFKYFYAYPSIDTRIISFFVKQECRKDFEESFINDFGNDAILLTKEEAEKYYLFGNTKYSESANNAMGEYIAIILSEKFMLCDKISLEDNIYTKGNHSGLTENETKIPLIVINQRK